jgi:glycosyltransferase involved in cell wall biosynthesis
MKVLHIVKTVVGAGWAYEQTRVLRSLGIEVVVALPSDTDGLAPRYREAGVTVVRADLDFPARQPWLLPARLRACRELVEQVRPDLIHTHHVGTTFVARAALGKDSPIPRVFGVTGTLHLEYGFFAWFDTHLAGPSDYWIATCRWTQRKYQELGIPANRVFLAYLGTDVGRYSEIRTGALRRELGIAPDVPLIGMVSLLYGPKLYLGREKGHKGHEDFISAFARLREARPEARAVMIGGTWDNALWYEHRVRYRAERLCNGGLACIGTRSDLAEIYPDLDLAVVPSFSDGLAYSVVEPLLAGVPVVATNVGGLPDLIQDGETGWLVPAGNPPALSRAMQHALDDPQEARRRAGKGQKAARSLIDLENTGKKVILAYENILALTARHN